LFSRLKSRLAVIIYVSCGLFMESCGFQAYRVYFTDCGMRKFEKVYFAEFHLRNIPQITPWSFSAFRIRVCFIFPGEHFRIPRVS